MGTTNSTPISAESTEPKSSDESSDSDFDKIEELEAVQGEALVESVNNVEENGNEENGDSDATQTATAVAKTTSLLETTSLSETFSSVENGTDKEVVEIEEFIKNDEDEDYVQEVSAPAPSKKRKIEGTKKEEPEGNQTAQKRLLDKLEEYVILQKDQPYNKTRKVLDTLLGAINAQVPKEPLSLRKLILDKVLVLPNTISFPPSQVCDLLIEHDSDIILSKVITRMYGMERPKLSDSEKRERALLKQHNPVPIMTKLLVDIGLDLVQEATYCDIVYAKNLPEVPRNPELYQQVAAQLKPVWETLKRKNEPYKMKMSLCQVCGFQTESKLVLDTHKQTLHYTGTKFQCTFCKEADTSEQRMKDHYFKAHLVIAIPEEKEPKYPCTICEEDFNFKGAREQHYKQCKRDYIRIRNIMAPKQDDLLYINRWLWERPPPDPSVVQKQQQEAAAAAQILRKQQEQQQQAKLREQQQAAQFRQMAQLLQQTQNSQQNRNMSNSLIAAMQAQLRRGGQQENAMMAKMMQQQMSSLLRNQQAQQLQAAMVSLKRKSPETPVNENAPRTVSTPSSSSTPTSNASPSEAMYICEICDQTIQGKDRYLLHLQSLHKQMSGKCLQDMVQGAPLACSRCRDRFWTYEGLERHLVMSHGLVTADLLLKAQKREDGGRCKTCGKQYAFNILQHLVADHQVKLISAEIMYSCDSCDFKCSSYQTLASHLSSTHPKGDKKASPAKEGDCLVMES